MARRTIDSLFDRNNLSNVNDNFFELYQTINNINIDTSQEIEEQLSNVTEQLKSYSKELNDLNLVGLNYKMGEDLFNKPPEGISYSNYAEITRDSYFSGLNDRYSSFGNNKITILPGGWFFYKIKIDSFTENTFTMVAKILKGASVSKVQYRFLDEGQLTGAATDFDLLDAENNIYGGVGIQIKSGKYLEIRFDNREASSNMVIENPVLFEGSEIKATDSEIKNIYLNLNRSNIQNNDTNQTELINHYSVPVKTPNEFEIKDHVLKDRIMTDGKGNFSVNYDITTNKLTGGQTYYVDIINGNDSNDGLSEEKALKSIRYAVEKSKDNDTIFIKEGTYFRYAGALFAKDFNKSLNIIGENDKVNIVIADQPNWNKTSGKTKVYEFARSSVRNVINIKLNTPLKNVGSIDEVDTTTNSWFTDNTKVYVNVNGTPNDNIVPIIAGTNFQVSVLSSNIYMENLNFIGGNNGVQLNMSKGNKAYLKNVNFYHSNPTFNGIAIVGGDLAILENCEASYNSYDGFNYHVGADGSLPFIVEIDCLAVENGSDKGTAGVKSNNGTTTHDGVKSIRVNGSYGRNDGGNVADVNSGTQSWNLGCSAFESYQGKDFQIASGAIMFLDNCTGFGSENSINVGNTEDAIYTRMGYYQNKLIAGKEILY
ncbi:hypothetical protein BUY42_00160 [Staphylococcus devriesei]|uniref:hypothetical protein n=1 Tax=Staphylococcus devriesei TaxID=586733 RepID=UPI000D1C907D|nr:hypothetical protein [Staphylococcus devriesei]PTF20429.1 hypothetical protein BUY42_00160 [Staphylococcus devriesei]